VAAVGVAVAAVVVIVVAARVAMVVAVVSVPGVISPWGLRHPDRSPELRRSSPTT
jgi:hypothetical protein